MKQSSKYRRFITVGIRETPQGETVQIALDYESKQYQRLFKFLFKSTSNFHRFREICSNLMTRNRDIQRNMFHKTSHEYDVYCMVFGKGGANERVYCKNWQVSAKHRIVILYDWTRKKAQSAQKDKDANRIIQQAGSAQYDYANSTEFLFRDFFDFTN